MNQFHFYHFNKAFSGPLRSSTPSLQNIAVWETCLRKIIFAEKLDDHNGELFEDEQALIFMLEILCGLQSRVIGETEIFGQFKQFLATEPAQRISFFKNPQFVQFIFQQVKEIRDKYVKQLGVSSYGSLIRKLCQRENEISLIGYGQLAQKVLPWISGRQVRIHVHDKSKYSDFENFTFINLDEANFYSTIIVAAPMRSENLAAALNSTDGVSQIIDCRSLDSEILSVKGSFGEKAIQIIELNDLFASIENKQEKMKSLLPVIHHEIRQRVQAYFFKSQHRPQGWEDLCG